MSLQQPLTKNECIHICSEKIKIQFQNESGKDLPLVMMCPDCIKFYSQSKTFKKKSLEPVQN